MKTNHSFNKNFARLFNQFGISSILIVIGLITITNLIKSSITIIKPGERGLVIELGRLQKQTLTEGLHFIKPWITEVKKISIRIERTDLEDGVRTKDLQPIQAHISLNWYLEPDQINVIYQTIGDEKQVIEKIITPSLNAALKEVTPKRTAEESLKQRDLITKDILKTLEPMLQQYGIKIAGLSIINYSMSQQMTSAIEAKQVAEQQVQEAKLKALKAEQDAQIQINLAKGQAESQRLLKQTLDPQVLQKEAIEKWDGKLPLIIGNNSNTLLDLNNLLNNQTQSK